MASTQQLQKVAREKLGFTDLHPGQREATESVLAGRDTLAIMPTGSGKSAIYQLAASLTDGPTVVISPLIALQRDQVERIATHDIGDAAELNSTMGAAKRRDTLEGLGKEFDFLFVAPEQFNSEHILAHLRAAKPALFVVDEAHSISEWGHDFRPAYLRLGAVIEELGHPTVLALTATASPAVRDEIIDRLGMRAPEVFVRNFDRPNIWLGVDHFHDERVKRDALVEAVRSAAKPGIVYAATHRHVEELTSALMAADVAATAYHAGLSTKQRTSAHTAFMADEVEVLVATTAFGMGVDKPNVRFVFHYDISDSVDSYYQEVGRAGRDGQPARALLFYRPEDLRLRRFFAAGGKVDVEQVERVEQAVEEHDGQAVDPSELSDETGLSRAKVMTALTDLQEVHAIDITATGEVLEEIGGDHGHAAEDAALTAEHHRLFEQSRVEMIRGYAETSNCRRGYVLNYFGEAFPDPCGHCDNCDAGRSIAQDVESHPFPLNSRVVHGAWGEGLVERYDGDSMVVVFDDAGYKTLLLDFVIESGALHAAE